MQFQFPCYASAAFGMEGLVSGELKKLGYSDLKTDNGGVRFSADASGLFLCNISMHFSDRIYILLKEGNCLSFDSLFNMVSSVDWQFYFSGRESIDISCKCTRSTLMSPRDCQSITKKAIIEKIRHTTGQNVFPEIGPSLSIHVSIRNDYAMIMLNTSGEALSRRGYRTWNGEAPIRETLASALVHLSGWQPGQPLHDPCCGTGTILAEAALLAAGFPPGCKRSFLMEELNCFRNYDFSALRSQYAEKAEFNRNFRIS